MKPIASFLFLLVSTTLCLSLLPRPATAAAAAAPKTGVNLIEQACAETHNKENCVASLESNPDSKTANLPELGIIALRLAADKATNISAHIKQLLTNTTLDPAVEQALEDCSDEYLDAVEQLDNSIAAVLHNATNDMRTWVQAAVADAEACEDAFTGNPAHESLLTSKNSAFRQLCHNALAINKLWSEKKQK